MRVRFTHGPPIFNSTQCSDSTTNANSKTDVAYQNGCEGLIPSVLTIIINKNMTDKNDLITAAKALLEGKVLNEKVSGFDHPDVTQDMLDAISEFDAGDVERLLQWMIEAWGDTGYENSDIRKLISNLKTTHRIWKNRSGN